VARFVVLLRGVNLAGRNRLSMPELREALEEAGFEEVSTYVQSGNVVLSSSKSATQVRGDVERLLADRFGLDVAVVVRTRAELARVVERNPLGTVAKNPKLYQVTFLESAPKSELLRRLESAAAGKEQVVSDGSELYAWHPDGIGRSKLAALMSGKALGVTGTARNWTTVTKLLEQADGARANG
jgi:uncharacterized protein (DUF1697 family)